AHLIEVGERAELPDGERLASGELLADLVPQTLLHVGMTAKQHREHGEAADDDDVSAEEVEGLDEDLVARELVAAARARRERARHGVVRRRFRLLVRLERLFDLRAE